MADSPQPTPAQQTAADLRAYAALMELEQHPAWGVFLAQFAREQERLADNILSSSMDAPQAELFRKLYIGLNEQYGPAPFMKSSLARLRAVADRHAKQVQQAKPQTQSPS